MLIALGAATLLFCVRTLQPPQQPPAARGSKFESKYFITTANQPGAALL